MKSFYQYVEEADEVLKIIQQSPNLKDKEPEFWEKYKERWGVKGQFIERKLPTRYLLGLINSNKLHLSRVDEKEVSNKQQSNKFNRIIIGLSDKYSSAPLAILDGTHSLVAAIRNKTPQVDVIISKEALKWLSLGDYDEPSYY